MTEPTHLFQFETDTPYERLMLDRLASRETSQQMVKAMLGEDILRETWGVIQAVCSSRWKSEESESQHEAVERAGTLNLNPGRRAGRIDASPNSLHLRRNSMAAGAQRTPTKAVTPMEEFLDRTEDFLAGRTEEGRDWDERSTVSGGCLVAQYQMETTHISPPKADTPSLLEMDSSQERIIEDKPIGNGLDSFQERFRSTCAELGISASVDAVQQVVKNGNKSLLFNLILDLLNLPATQPLGLVRELSMLFAKLQLNQQNLQAIVPLLTKVVENAPDKEIWDAAYRLTAPLAVTPPTTPTDSTPLRGLETPTKPRPQGEFTTPRTPKLSGNSQALHLDQTPTVQNTAGIVNSSERRNDFDKELQSELGTTLYTGVPGFDEAFFGGVSKLKEKADRVFGECQDGDDPIFNKEAGGWKGWPNDAKEAKVLEWFQKVSTTFLKLGAESDDVLASRMRILSQPNKPVPGSVSKRKLDIGFVHQNTLGQAQYDWSRILVPGELKSNRKEDAHQSTWLDLARYVREIFAAQDARRFVQGFTLCGSLMRLWEFDRLGGIASSAFDINKDGLRFVKAVLGYNWMTDEQLGFDPTITSEDGNRYMTITKGSRTERLVIVDVIKPYHSIIGRGTICWKVHREGDKSKQVIVVKDSWQYPERDEEGEYLLEATKSKVVNLARYHHHETVCVGGKDDNIVDNVRKGLDVGEAENALRISRKMREEEEKKKKDQSITRSMAQLIITSKTRNSGTKISLPGSTPAVPTTPQENEADSPIGDRVHRRVIMLDYGHPLYEASSRVALLAGLEGGIRGHRSLYEAGILHRDISVNNVLVNEENNSGFLIDLDLAIRVNRLKASGARDKTGTKVFMAIGALIGHQHSFMHDLESFFWVLFWICIHYSGPKEAPRVMPEFDNWNYLTLNGLARMKAGTINNEQRFVETMITCVAPYFQPLIPCINELRKIVFPNNSEWMTEDRGLYERMIDVLKKAKEDKEVIGG